MVPRVLLLTGVAPGRVNVGRIFLRSLCLVYPQDRICCFHVKPLPESEKSPDLVWLPTAFSPAPREHGIGRFGNTIAEVSRSFVEYLIEFYQIPLLIERVVRFGRDQKVDLVWATLECPTTIRMAKVVADQLKVPLVTTIWDPPSYKIDRQYNPDHHTLSRLLATFAETLRSAVHCGVASDGMKRRYERDYGTDCVVMIYAPPREAQTREVHPLSTGGPLVIGFAGSIYAREEWNAFLAALEGRDWRIADRAVVVKVLGSSSDQHTPVPGKIEFLGWQDPIETVRLLSQMDIAYLPYWFGNEYQDVVQLTFPNKLAAYAAARLPVLYHGPIQSSPALFFDRFPIGISCHSLNPEDIVESLERLAIDSELCSRAKLACDDAFHLELSEEVFRRRFARLIGISEHDLLH